MSLKNILDGTIKLEAPIPDPLKVDQVKAGEISASYAGIKEATIPTLSTSALSTDKLAINGKVVLNTLTLNDTILINAFYAADPTTGRQFTQKVDLILNHLTGGAYVLSVYGGVTGIGGPLSYIDISVGFPCNPLLEAFSPVALKTDNGYVKGAAHLTAKDNKMFMRIHLDIGDTYTEAAFKINMFFISAYNMMN